MERKELKTKKDIASLVDLFYKNIQKDPLLGPIFHLEISSWEEHLPKMYAFWESQLLDENSYSGNPLVIHQNLNQKQPLTPAHFKQWITIFNQTINTHFTGELAEKAKQRALSIKTVMEIKICH